MPRRVRLVLLAMIVSSAAGWASVSAAHEREPSHVHIDGTTVSLASFAGLGTLAFVSNNHLFVLDGGSHSVRKVPTPALSTPLSPSFSPDGRWLAFLTRKITGGRGTTSLWVASAQGTSAQPVKLPGDDIEIVGWDPRRDVLAVISGPQSNSVPFGQPTEVRLVNPDRSSHVVMTSSDVVGAVWSPGGNALAVSTESHTFTGTLTSFSMPTGRSTTWISGDRNFIVPAGWWPGWGIGFTTVNDGGVPGGSASADGSPLYTIARPGESPRLLGTTLMDMAAGRPGVGTDGELTFTGDVGNGSREIGQGWGVETCAPTGGCRTIPSAAIWSGANPQPCLFVSCDSFPRPGEFGSAVSLDPAWSPTRPLLAYDKAPVALTGGSPTLSWYNAHQLEIFDPSTDASTAVDGGSGAAVPSWSRDGKTLLYVSNDGLWVDVPPSGRPTEIAHPLFALGPTTPASFAFSSYYGQVDWLDQFSWWSPA